MGRFEEKKVVPHMNRVFYSNTAHCRRTKSRKIWQPSTSKTSPINTQKPCL